MVRAGIYTFKALAQKAGITRQSISYIKARGTCAPESAIKIAKALGVDVADLLESKRRSKA